MSSSQAFRQQFGVAFENDCFLSVTDEPFASASFVPAVQLLTVQGYMGFQLECPKQEYLAVRKLGCPKPGSVRCGVKAVDRIGLKRMQAVGFLYRDSLFRICPCGKRLGLPSVTVIAKGIFWQFEVNLSSSQYKPSASIFNRISVYG